MWRVLSIAVIVWAVRFRNGFVNKKCLCNKPNTGPTFLRNGTKRSRFLPHLKEPVIIPRQCPQNMRNWKGIKDFLGTVESATVSHCAISDNCRRVGNRDNQDKLKSIGIFDFIVVGAGAAGSIVAGRLATHTSKTVLLLEAGGVDPIYSRVPAFYKYFRNNASTDWMFKTSYSRTYCSAGRGECTISRGKGLGGTTMFNDMIYLRGHPQDCEDWFEREEKEYTCSDFEYYYRKFENVFEKEYSDDFLYGTDGPMPVQRFKHQHIMIDRLINATQELGYEYIENMLDNNTLTGGFGLVHSFTGNGQRYTPARTYLHPDKRNLLVVLNTHVNKILFDENDRAYKLEYVMNEDWNNKMYVEARQEIILSAGAINTPKILMLSGIGPQAVLKSVNIPVFRNLPVGENLQFHYGFRMRYGIGYRADHHKKVRTYVYKALLGETLSMYLWVAGMSYLLANAEMSKYIFSDLLNDYNLNIYLETGTGPLASNGLLQLIGMLSSNITEDKTKPDIQILFSGLQADCSRTDRQNLTPSFESYYPIDDYVPIYNGSRFVILNGTPTWGLYRVNIDLDVFAGRKIDVYILLLDPRSIGNVTLRTSNPKDAPIIDAHFFEDDEDVARLVEAGRTVDNIFQSDTMKSLRMEMPVTYYRPCATAEWYSLASVLYFQTIGYYFYLPKRNLTDDFFACLAKHHTVAEYHQQGTASIGTVVDENLAVKTVGGLRVVDGSVIPTTMSGSPQATIMMLAERSIGAILKDLKTAQDNY